jgi:hypothetical protein
MRSRRSRTRSWDGQHVVYRIDAWRQVCLPARPLACLPSRATTPSGLPRTRALFLSWCGVWCVAWSIFYCANSACLVYRRMVMANIMRTHSAGRARGFTEEESHQKYWPELQYRHRCYYLASRPHANHAIELPEEGRQAGRQAGRQPACQPLRYTPQVTRQCYLLYT